MRTIEQKTGSDPFSTPNSRHQAGSEPVAGVRGECYAAGSETEQGQESDGIPSTQPAQTPLWTRGFVLLCLLNFLNFSGMWMLPALLPLYIHSLGAADWILGLLTALTAVATIITRPLAGWATVRFGRRGVFSVGTIGMIVTSVAFALAPLVSAVLTIRFIQGLAWGLTNTACSTIATDSIPKARYGEGMGYFTQASSVAMVITPALGLAVFTQWGGSAAVLICAGFYLLSLLCSCFIRYRRMPQPSQTLKQTTNAGGAAQEPGTSSPSNRRNHKLLLFITNILLERKALVAAVLMMLTASAYGILFTYLPTMLETRSLGSAGPFFVVMALSAFVARPVFGRWADKRTYLEPALSAFICMVVSLLALAFVGDMAVLLIAAVLMGIGYSTGFSLFLAAATLGAPLERRGSAIATVMVGFDIGAGLAALCLGAVASWFTYTAVFCAGAAIAAVGLIVLLNFRKRLPGAKD
ncbi:MAG: MFS transporter [Coriobacteriales bacterium]|jgi:MFS family permease|nr:MFS transporter [Coriobacteriales bacterium]